MELTVQNLAGCFDDSEISPVMLNNPHNKIREVSLFDSTSFLESGVLFVGKFEDLIKTDFNNRNINVLGTGDIDISLFTKGCNNLNLLKINPGHSYAEIFNRIQKLLHRKYSEESSEDHQNSIFSSVFHGKGIQNILNVGRDLISNPVYLLTQDSVLIAKSSEMVIHDPVCEELDRTGTISASTANHIQMMFDKDGYVIRDDRPKLWNSADLPYRRLMGYVCLPEGTRYAVIVLAVNHDFTENSNIIFTAIMNALRMELSESNWSDGINEVIKASLITSLLDGSVKDQESLTLRLSHIKWKIPEKYRLYVIDLQLGTDTHLTFYQEIFRSELREEGIYLYKHYLLCILDKNGLKKFEDRKARIINILEENNLHSGISNMYTSLLDIPKAFHQVKHVLALSERLKWSGVIYESKDYLLDSMIDDLAEHYSLMDYCHPLIQEIIQYDKENDSSYFETLAAYIRTGLNSDKTAKELHIHRNTAFYRIRRLEELFHIDWSDMYLLSSLELSILIFARCR